MAARVALPPIIVDTPEAPMAVNLCWSRLRGNSRANNRFSFHRCTSFCPFSPGQHLSPDLCLCTCGLLRVSGLSIVGSVSPRGLVGRDADLLPNLPAQSSSNQPCNLKSTPTYQVTMCVCLHCTLLGLGGAGSAVCGVCCLFAVRSLCPLALSFPTCVHSFVHAMLSTPSLVLC